ncbi:Sec-independent protein translocase protein TatB [Methylomonas sp. SURF-2]|uniref:Sec-independent protein translocase protein TatB n=1 Tax=Methylomonas subterranea TaxID=2952225 RepID=A0ABT1TE25_9GAMM|nr:Sec-independent protein translocase protein TatB [Methylomonas sp. SURF-2]MCQ8103501.1 Sec-independent protein translocase protein TatB [Methylomonas sp. SURF-2]
MFDVGFSEMLMVGLVGLLVLGPERLPKLAREAALWLGKARSLLHDAKAEIKRELDLEELKELRALNESMQLPRIDPLALLQESASQTESAETIGRPAPASSGASHG